jgi:hypothetical protein
MWVKFTFSTRAGAKRTGKDPRAKAAWSPVAIDLSNSRRYNAERGKEKINLDEDPQRLLRQEPSTVSGQNNQPSRLKIPNSPLINIFSWRVYSWPAHQYWTCVSISPFAGT